jgi:hypothetical protein
MFRTRRPTIAGRSLIQIVVVAMVLVEVIRRRTVHAQNMPHMVSCMK